MSLSHRTARTVVNARHYPLGAKFVDDGVNFALYSRNASAVFLPEAVASAIQNLDFENVVQGF